MEFKRTMEEGEKKGWSRGTRRYEGDNESQKARTQEAELLMSADDSEDT